MMGRKQKPVPPTRDLATDRMKILEICQETYSHLFTGYSQKAGMPRFSRSRSRGQGQLGKESGCPYPRVSAHWAATTARMRAPALLRACRCPTSW